MAGLLPLLPFAFVKDLRTNTEGRAARPARSMSARIGKARIGAAVQSRTNAQTAADPAAATACPAASDPRFHESTSQRVRRWVLGTAYALRPNRIALMPRLALMSLSHAFAPAGTRDKLPEHPVYYSPRGLVGI